MSTTAIRQKLHSYLEVANDKKVKALYTMMKDDVEESTVEYTNAFKKELDKRYTDYKSGKVKAFTATESRKRISKILNARKK